MTIKYWKKIYERQKYYLLEQGKLSEGMLHSIQMIVGEIPDVSCIEMLQGKYNQQPVDAVEKKLKENLDIQYIVIADLFGGRVCNVMSLVTGYPNMKMVAGMNMGLVFYC